MDGIHEGSRQFGSGKVVVNLSTALALLFVCGVALAACGGDDETEALNDLTEVIEAAPEIEVETPAKAAKCLRKEGFAVAETEPTSLPDGAESQLELSGKDDALITWHLDSAAALQANASNGDTQASGTVVGAKGRVAYLLGPTDDPSDLTTQVLPCI